MCCPGQWASPSGLQMIQFLISSFILNTYNFPSVFDDGPWMQQVLRHGDHCVLIQGEGESLLRMVLTPLQTQHPKEWRHIMNKYCLELYNTIKFIPANHCDDFFEEPAFSSRRGGNTLLNA